MARPIARVFHWKNFVVLIDPRKPQNFSTLKDLQYMVAYRYHVSKHVHVTKNKFSCSDSFDLRAPKRRNVVKMKLSTLPHGSISQRPPAALPENGNTTTEDESDYDDYSNIDINDSQAHTSSALETTTDDQYDYVITGWKSTSNTIPRQKNAAAMLAQGNTH